MRMLRLENSGDTHSSVPPELRAGALSKRMLEADLGTSLEVVAKQAWPSPRLPALVDRWMDEAAPDVVYFKVSTYPFVYESFPLRVQRRLGRLGPAVLRAGDRTAQSAVGRTPVFHRARRLLLALFGGDTYFTVDEVHECVAESIRIILKHEHVTLIVRGPVSSYERAQGRRATARGERKRRELHARLQALCARLHVEYAGRDEIHQQAVPRADGVHFDAPEHEVRARFEAEAIARAIRAGRTEVTAP